MAVVIRLVLALLLVLLPLGENAIAGRNFWVAIGGSDANPCTDSSTPLSAAASKATPTGVGSCPVAGDTVHFGPGQYNDSIRGVTSWTANGTQALPITAVSTVQYGAVIQFVEAVDWMVIDGFKIDASTANQGQNECIGIGHTVVRNNEIVNCPHQGLLSGGAGQNWIHHNLIHHIAYGDANDPPANDHGIYLDDDNNIVEFNEIYDIEPTLGGWGVQIYNGNPSPTASNNIIRYNFLHDLASGGLQGGPFQAHGNQLYNNVIVGLTGSGCINSFDGTGFTVVNNVCYGTKYGLNVQGSTGGSGHIILNNALYNMSGGIYVNVNNSTIDHNACDTGGSGICGTNALITNTPGFVNPIIGANGDFSLQNGSPLINAGIATIPAVLCNGVCDIGAFETATAVGGQTLDTSHADFTVSSAHAPFSDISVCTGLTLLQNSVSQILTGCQRVGNATYRLTCANCLIANTNVAVSNAQSSGIHDTINIGMRLNQLLLPFTNFSIPNTISGGGPIFTTEHFRVRSWNHNVTSNTPQDWNSPQDVTGAVQAKGKISVVAAIQCTGGNCNPSGFPFVWQLNGVGGFAPVTNSCATDPICYDNTQVGGAINGASIPTSLLTNPQPTFVAGTVEAQNSSFAIITLPNNSATNVMGSFAINSLLLAGVNSICVKPQQDNGQQIPLDGALPVGAGCFNVVNPTMQIK